MSNLALRLRAVRKHYPSFTLGDLDFDLEPGQIMGLVGPNGAGKSTTIRIIMGLIHADSGECSVLGYEMPREQVAARSHIGYVSEDMRLYPTATLEWHMGFIRSLFPAWDDEYAGKLLSRFELRAGQRLARFSHGERVKAMLLLALARKPRLLVLDEPSTGLDPVARHDVLAELMDVLRDEERTILFSSHNTRDVERISDSITFIDRGKVVASRDKESYLESWRRLRLRLTGSESPADLPGVVEFRRDGHSVVITTNRFSPEVLARLEQCPLEILAVEPLTLEEIFIATVHAGRQGGAV